MEIIKARKLKYDYFKYDENGQASESQTAVEDVDLDIQPGQFISILGHNGSGKSTLAKHMNALLIPTEGTIWVDGMDTAMEPELWKIRQKAGMVFQNPDNQIIGTVVEEDVGFGPENLGIPTEGIWSRVNKSLEAVGMTAFRHRSPNKLSGGQKQRVAIAGVMAMQPKCIIMDEPTAMLDPNGRKEVLEAVHELNRREGITVILITHYMEEVIDSDRVFVMDQGHVVMQGTPREIFSRVEELKAYRLDVPQVTLLAYELKKAGNGQASESQTAVENVDLDIQPGQFISILGHNGSGKSTLAKHMNALLIPTEGTIWVDGMDTAMEPELWKIRQKAGMVFQNPDNQIIGTVVEEDVGFGPENLGIPTEGIWSRVNKSLEAVGMTAFRHRSPNKLSGGQKQRVAIAGVMAMQPKCIIMDEPTAMLDPNGRKEVLEAVHELNRREGITVILITHYMEEVIDSDRVFVMDQGHVVMQGTPREIFSRVEELKAYRLDVPQVTLLAYELKKAGIPLPEGILTTKELVDALCH